MNTIPVVVWADQRGLVSELERLGDQVVVTRHCEDLAEVLAVIGVGLASLCVLAGPSIEITEGFVSALQRVDGRGLCLVSEPTEELRLSRLGLQVLGYETPAAEIVACLRRSPRHETHTNAEGFPGQPEAAPGSVPPRGAWSRYAATAPTPQAASAAHPSSDINMREAAPTFPPTQEVPRNEARMATVTVVWGTPGAPGRSTVALNLAVETALAGFRVSLVDADTHAAALSPMLGLLDETAGLVRLVRAVADNTFEPAPDSAAHARVHVGGAALRLTSGLPRPQRWAEVSSGGLTDALNALRRASDHVIVDIAADVGHDEDLAIDTFAPQRNDAARAALAVADRILIVGTADPVGLPRLVRACEELGEHIDLDSAQVEVVINKVSASSSGPSPETSLYSAWRRFGPRGLVPNHLLPRDQQAMDAAVLNGKALAELAPRSPLRKAIAAMAEPRNRHSSGAGQQPYGTRRHSDRRRGKIRG